MERTITPAELKRLSNTVLIDVRREADFATGPAMISGALRRQPESVDIWAHELPLDRDVVVYCARGGSVSNKVLDELLEKGLHARFLEGGIEAWENFQKESGE